MIIYPAIDLKEGRCVRLYQGDFAQETVVNPDPIKQAIAFEKAGAKALHIVDLDGALSGDLTNLQVIQAILAAITIPIQVGGGIRSMAQVARYLDAGVSRVIIGSKAVEDPAFVAEAVQQYGDQIAVGIDAKDGLVATRGWLAVSDQNYLTVADQMAQLGVKTIIFTDIAKDGTLMGPNLEQLQAIAAKVPDLQIIASGGISSREDLEAVKALGVYGVISGKALYNGNITMTDVVEVGE
ncbi:MAG: 1-(5-phosphoribosyl)-5-[(5-phosphoribosylamino)methylideneamino]imidazole-4-carboxamide isomerase [Enterococcus aquimarinus]|uniref:1-(5-phosphoribosyl)-5-[(5-phosphoribosylamino)methylideneamino] imidazole-4-carboxamide isomerase n=1 Tax=Enterococcus aquimarinus TaxID=328396 RepID=A0A9E3ZVX3_9ENTE|nr:1-(5-phosphoribosyl)-5-[(5-phosphoribosylamino)methylideneamino]imidazole-4-carboxamide isomerase [Enterococcus aquimarinus]